MNGVDLAFAGVYLVVTVVWAVVAHNSARLLANRHLRSPFFRFLPPLGAAMAGTYGLVALFAALPATLHVRQPPALLGLYHLWDAFSLAALTIFRHMTLFLAGAARPPGPAWLAGNYGSAAAVLAARAFPEVGAPHNQPLFIGYVLVVLGLTALRLARVARSGVWRPGAITLTSRPDMVCIALALLALAGVALVHLAGGWDSHRRVLRALGAVVALALAAPLAARMLGAVVRGLTLTAMTVAVAGSAYLVATSLLAPGVAPELAPVLPLLAVVGVALLAAPVVTGVRAATDRLLFRRRREAWAALDTLLQSLSPELGRVECCRRVLAEVVRIARLPGAAILLRDGEAMICGAVPLDAVLRVWPRGTQADALPADKVLGVELPQAELREALAEDGILGVQPIVSPRHRWGDMFFATGPFGLIFSDEEIATIASIAGRLALLLDGTELLARTVAAERVLAHREKLAALGELSARIAHEIRNPVTAARSLAQQLARLPSAADAEAARLILTELDRVERQVADLLRFARREDYRLEPADLAAVVRTAAQAVRPRLEAAGIGLVLELVSDLPTRCDREKIRQLVINLLENAGEALAGSAGPREVVVALRAEDGTAHLSVADNGPGVPADALPHLFEPFFSLKEHGTGLGLAIARRTVEAHGGRISARPGDAGGMRIEVALPLGAAGHSSPPRGTSGSEAAEGRTS